MVKDWATSWVADRLREGNDFATVDITPSGLLSIDRRGQSPFKVAALGIKDVVEITHVLPFISFADLPQFIINVPSDAIWTGSVIELVHNAPAAFAVWAI